MLKRLVLLPAFALRRVLNYLNYNLMRLLIFCGVKDEFIRSCDTCVYCSPDQDTKELMCRNPKVVNSCSNALYSNSTGSHSVSCRSERSRMYSVCSSGRLHKPRKYFK